MVRGQGICSSLERAGAASPLGMENQPHGIATAASEEHCARTMEHCNADQHTAVAGQSDQANVKLHSV